MLTETHMPLYRTIRKAHPTTPIIFITKPDCDYDKFALERKAVIYNTYQTALNEGDKYVDFIDGKDLFGTEDRELCTADKCHPNDLGFYRMAKVIEPVLRKWLEK
jgi:lysophospholipase L1-like esterase